MAVSIPNLEQIIKQYMPTVPHMEWGTFSTDTGVFRVTFKMPYLKSPSVLCVGSARIGNLTPPTYTAAKITLPTLPNFAKVTLPAFPTFAKINLPPLPTFAAITLPALPTFPRITLPTIPAFATITLPIFEIPRVATPNLGDTLSNSFRDAANRTIGWPYDMTIPIVNFSVKTILVVLAAVFGGLVGGAIDKLWSGNFQPQIDQIRNKLNEGIGTFRNNVQSTINSYSTNLNNGLSTLRNNFQSTIDTYSNTLNTGLSTIRNNIQSTIDAYSANLNTGVSTLRSNTQAAIDQFGTNLTPALTNYNANLQSVINQFSTNINTAFQNYNSLLQASVNSINAQIQDSNNKSFAALYKMLGVPAGILATPVALNSVTPVYFDIVGVPGARFWWFAIEQT